MNLELIERILPELHDALMGASFRSVFQLGPDRFALAFEGEGFRLLFISIRPGDPRIYLIRRRLRDVKRLSTHPSQFAITLEKTITGTRVNGLRQIGEDRVIEIRFSEHQLIVQLTGKSSNLFLLDSEGKITAAGRRPSGEGQSVGAMYAAPEPHEKDQTHAASLHLAPVSDDTTVSEALDNYFQSLDDSREFKKLADAAKLKNRQEITKLNRLIKNLNSDLHEHGDAEKWKRFGDLLLINQSAERNGTAVRVRDLFDQEAPVIEIEVDENASISEAAESYFRRYTKARNARTAFESRLRNIKVELQRLEKISKAIEKAIGEEDKQFINEIVGKKGSEGQKTPQKKAMIPSGIRTFISADGFEILVGKKATDNDYLTSRIANSRDTWMHAADYPGSHVVIRNPNNKEVPHGTLIDAAQLAAFYSQGKKQPKAAVHYTLKKFVSKPKGVAPGLVRLASFKTILVEPKIGNAKPITR